VGTGLSNTYRLVCAPSGKTKSTDTSGDSRRLGVGILFNWSRLATLISLLLCATGHDPTKVRPHNYLSSHLISSSVFPHSTGSSAFSQTLQFITSVKLQELQRQSETFSKHVDDVIDRACMAENDIDKVQKLLDGVNTWTGLGGLTTTDIPLENIQLYVRSSYHPNRSSKLR